MAQQVLKHLVHEQERKVTIDAIQKAVAEQLQLDSRQQLKQKSNTHKIVYPRQVAMYLVKELTTPRCRRSAGPSAASTTPPCIHSIQKIEKQRQTDPDLNRMIHSLMDSLQ